ncbi:type IV pilus modification PilV family protein [Nitrincola alkalilacustris]|uniref:type IV pilus modification PilV family protein n=1 Tax=Nitrincola alkalilacustris TaxID=1571224 RepID=UPI001456A6AB|nr:prepilin-type N-terminal cleavage/methylation domain-containing protein [Nitrincola alkalilacustris]
MRTQRYLLKQPDRHRGFSLIEILITIVVVSVGVLSLVLLQARSMQFAQASYQRSVAVMQVNDLVERLWTGVCSLPDSFEVIHADWVSVHSQSLPGWDGDDTSVDTAANPPVYTITVQWSDERVRFDLDDATETAHSFTHMARIPVLPC